MTIAAGFRVLDGVLICADTEHSAGGMLTHESKVIPADFSHGKVIFALSGENVELAKAAVQKCVEALRASHPNEIRNHHDIAALVERIIHREYRKHVCPKPSPSDASVYQLLMAAWTPHDGLDGPGLYCTFQGTIRECDSYECVGTGFYLGRYLIESMFNRGMDLHSARIVATYAIAQAKARVDGCSGQTHIAMLKTDGAVEGTRWDETKNLEETFQAFDAERWSVLLDLLTQSDIRFQESLYAFNEQAIRLRVTLGLDEKSRKAILGMDSIATMFMPKDQPLPEQTIHDPSTPPPSLE
jgi:20S proteasome alpha/beta subunit